MEKCLQAQKKKKESHRKSIVNIIKLVLKK